MTTDQLSETRNVARLGIEYRHDIAPRGDTYEHWSFTTTTTTHKTYRPDEEMALSADAQRGVKMPQLYTRRQRRARANLSRKLSIRRTISHKKVLQATESQRVDYGDKSALSLLVKRSRFPVLGCERC